MQHKQLTTLKRLHSCFNVVNYPKDTVRVTTKDGIEHTFQLNFPKHFNNYLNFNYQVIILKLVRILLDNKKKKQTEYNKDNIRIIVERIIDKDNSISS